MRLAPKTIIDGDLGGLEPATTARFELARADRLGRVISNLVSRIDRSSGRDHEKLVSLLINQELALRDAERSIRWSEPSGLNTSAGRSQRDSALIESARSDRLEILRRAGLEDDLASAQAYLGQSPKGVERTVIGAPELYASDRIRSPGDRTTFVGVVPGVERAADSKFAHHREPESREILAPRAHPAGTDARRPGGDLRGDHGFSPSRLDRFGRPGPGLDPNWLLGRAARRTCGTGIDHHGLVDTTAQPNSSLIGWPPSTILMGRPRGVVY